MVTVRYMIESDDKRVSVITKSCYQYEMMSDGLYEAQVGFAVREYCTPS
jgi:hypothetical protein